MTDGEVSVWVSGSLGEAKERRGAEGGGQGYASGS